MFEELLRELRRLEQEPVEVSLPTDEEGYLDRECPHHACLVAFKVLLEDWQSKVREEEAFCPSCREQAPKSSWHTQEQVAYAHEVAMAKLGPVVAQALRAGAAEFNRAQPRDSFIQMSMSVNGPSFRAPEAVPAAELLRQKYTCEACGCRYSSLGSAFFCPACGNDSANQSFASTVDTVRSFVTQLPILRATLESTSGPDLAHDICRATTAQALANLVGAFEHFTRSLFTSSFPDVRVNRGQFQRVPDASEAWRRAVGVGYEDLVTRSEFDDLCRLVQQRHLVTHNGGVVDQAYIDKTCDRSYDPGQRLVVKEASVLRLADITTKLATALASRGRSAI